MGDKRLLLIGRLPAATKEGRDKVEFMHVLDFSFIKFLQIIAGMDKIAKYAKEHDPETTKHATHLSQDLNDANTVWAIEEYVPR